MSRLLVGLLVLLLVLAACAEEDAPAPTVAPSPTGTPESSPTPLPTPMPVDTPTTTSPPTATPTPAPPTATVTPEPAPTFVPTPAILPTAGVVFGTPTPLPGDPITLILEAVQLRVNVVRELTSQRPVERQFINRDELGVLLIELFEEDREEILEDQKLYATLGILDKGTDLFDLLLGLYSEGVLGYYSSEEDKFYVVSASEELAPSEERTYVHEYVHALQQQHFDFESLFDEIEDNSDASAALRALLEGDARLSETAYVFEYMSAEDRAVSEGQASDALIQAFRAAPRVIQRQYLFPYIEGVTFAITLYQQQGWEGMNRAFDALPRSTEQILHPERYVAGDEPIEVELPDLVEAVGEGWSLVKSDTFGEFMIQAYIETAFAPERAFAAAEGWGGDAFSLLEGPQGETLFVLSSVWDTEADAAEFREVFMQFTENLTGGVWQDENEGLGISRMVLADQVIQIRIRESDTLIIFAPDIAVLETTTKVLP
jgi:hypothetical protein